MSRLRSKEVHRSSISQRQTASSAGVCAGIASSLLIPLIAYGADSDSAAAEDTSTLQEVTITAQRREESLQHAAVAVSAISGDQILDAGITNSEALAAVVPALKVAPAAGPYPLFYIRGVGNFNGNPLSDSAVAFNVDGVYVSRPSSSSSGTFYDLQRIEVLKGPQGTLYGRNATGGAINVITHKPDLDTFDATLNAEVGNFDAVKVDGALNVPFGTDTAARLAFQTSDHSGYLSDNTSDERSAAVRFQVLTKPIDSLRITFGTDFSHQGGRGAGDTLLSDSFVSGRVGIQDPRAGAVYAQTLYFPAGNFFAAMPPSDAQDNSYWGVNLTAEWQTSAGTLTAIPAYRRSDLDYGSTFPSFNILQRERDTQSSLEVRFASNGDHPLSYLLGAYYLADRIDSHDRYNNQFNISYEDFRAPTDSAAAFGRLTYTIVPALRLTGGVRYTRDDKSLDGAGLFGNVLCPAALVGGNPTGCLGGPIVPYTWTAPAAFITAGATGFPQPWGTQGNIATANDIAVNHSARFDKTTWRGALDWDVAPDSLLYASVETGFKAGGFFFTDDNPVYKPETLTAYTLGSKNRFLDNRLQLNGELFYWDYKNQQLSHITRDSLGAVVFATENVGSSTLKGLEVETEYLATPDTLLHADVDYLDARYDKFDYSVPNLGAPPVANCPATATALVYLLNCSGKTPPESPKWTANLGIQQTFRAGNAKIVAEADTRFQSRTLTGQEFLAIEEQGGYWITNASIIYKDGGGHWSVGAYVRNLTDRTVVTETFPHPLAGAAVVSAAVNAPRTYGARVSLSF